MTNTEVVQAGQGEFGGAPAGGTVAGTGWGGWGRREVPARPNHDGRVHAVGVAGRRWEALEDRGRALVPEAACKVGEWGCIGVDWLASAGHWLAGAAAGGWEELVGPLPSQRSYRRIVASPHLEAWVIFWPEGGRLQLHDHGGANGALTVVTGALDEQYLDGGRAPGRRRTIIAGSGVSFDGTYIHDVYNAHPVPATSVHVYSAASQPMGFYDLAGGFLRRLPRAVDGASIVEQDMAADD